MGTPNLEVGDTFVWEKSTNENDEKGYSSLSDEEGYSSSGNEEDSCQVKTKKLKTENVIDEDENFSKATGFDPYSSAYLELETLDQCERLVLLFPNSSKAWILYMVFHLKQAEVVKARNVAEKALNVILYRDDSEKLNIWFALLNLEVHYGSQESLMDTFERAIACNDPRTIYFHLVDLYIKSEKTEEAEQLLEVMVEKLKHDKHVWIKFINFYMKSERPELARKLMDRSFETVDKKFHPDIMGKVAQLEFEYGDLEKGRNMFEAIIQNHPQRRDLLSIYISLLNKTGNEDQMGRLASVLKKR